MHLKTHIYETVVLGVTSIIQHCHGSKPRQLINQTIELNRSIKCEGGREGERESDTIRSIDFNRRHIGRDEPQEEPTNGVSECEDDQRPPKRHRFLEQEESKAFAAESELENENLWSSETMLEESE